LKNSKPLWTFYKSWDQTIKVIMKAYKQTEKLQPIKQINIVYQYLSWKGTQIWDWFVRTILPNLELTQSRVKTVYNNECVQIRTLKLASWLAHKMIQVFSTGKENRQKLQLFTHLIILERVGPNKAHFLQVLMGLKRWILKLNFPV
jgi:hypothetical protein